MALPSQPGEIEPRLAKDDRVSLLAPNPPGNAPRIAECQLVYLDAETGRLIVTPSDTSQAFSADADAPLLVLIVRPGEPVLARPCVVEARLEQARWLVLYPTAPWRMIQRRLVERADVHLSAAGHRYMTSGGGLAVRGVVRNLSMTGFLFESGTRVGLGELLVLDCSLPDGEEVRLRGQVVRTVRTPTNSWHVGCQFSAVPMADQERIARLIQGSIAPDVTSPRGPTRDKQTDVKTVVIADDDPAIRLLVATTLSSDKYSVIEATDGGEAWRLIREHRPAVVILDWEMPVYKGLELSAVIKGDPQLWGTTVIMLTGHVSQADREAGARARADLYLVKPFSPQQVLTAVEQALGIT